MSLSEKLKHQLNTILKLDIDWLVDDEQNKIDVYGSTYWGANTKEEYERQEKLINSYLIENELVRIKAWCDISGFEYWMENENESNYVSIDVFLLKDAYSDEEIKEIGNLIYSADSYFIESLTDFYDTKYYK